MRWRKPDPADRPSNRPRVRQAGGCGHGKILAISRQAVFLLLARAPGHLRDRTRTVRAELGSHHIREGAQLPWAEVSRQVDVADVSSRARGAPRLLVIPLGLSLGVFLLFTYVLCIVFDLLLPGQAMYETRLRLLPGFTWLNWGSFLLSGIESFTNGCTSPWFCRAVPAAPEPYAASRGARSSKRRPMMSTAHHPLQPTL